MRIQLVPICVFFLATVTLATESRCQEPISTQEVASWRAVPARHWPGKNIWANRLQDWSVKNGALHCLAEVGGTNWRTAHLLSHDLADEGNRFRIEVEIGGASAGQAGLLIAAGEGSLNYKQAALVQSWPGKGGGFLITWNFEHNQLVIGDFGEEVQALNLNSVKGVEVTQTAAATNFQRAILVLVGKKIDQRIFRLTTQLVVKGLVKAESNANVSADRLVGNIALASLGSQKTNGHAFHWVRVGGDRIAVHEDREFGPIAGVLYSVANGDLQVGVQCMSLGQTISAPTKKSGGSRLAVRLEKKTSAGTWQPASSPAGISEPDYYALLRVENYDSSQPQQFRVVINGVSATRPYTFSVPAEPKNNEEITIGGVSCTGVMGRRGSPRKWTLAEGEQFFGRWTHANVWAPYEGVSKPLLQTKPDIVFFTGDQLYEENPTPADAKDSFPVDDYLYKWLIWHWAFGEVTRQVPCILQTDDHDVWHPNLWGDGGRLMTERWDSGGGFLKSAYFVNLVQRTMCGHNPDPYDAGPLDSGVTNYFTTFTYGGVDFAVLEDRKFKSAAVDSTRQAVPLQLLGDSQLEMLSKWAQAKDASPARIVVSQTNYAKVSTWKNGTIGVVRDSDGWPKPARDRAVELFQKSGAMLFTGDQHLATVCRLETPAGPGVYQFCQPAGACIWWRWFYPNRKEHLTTPGNPDYTGRFKDGYGNRFEVLAAANPAPKHRMPLLQNPQQYKVTAEEASQGIGTKRRLHAGEGFALIRINAERDQLVLECWPNETDFSSREEQKQFFGWPIELGLPLRD